MEASTSNLPSFHPSNHKKVSETCPNGGMFFAYSHKSKQILDKSFPDTDHVLGKHNR